MGADVLDDDKVVVVKDGPAWHSLGIYSEEDMTAMEGHERMGGSYTLTKRPVGVNLLGDDDLVDGDNFIKVPGHYAIVRGPTNKDNHYVIFDYVTSAYHVIQVVDILQKFDDMVGKSISSMGLLQNGKKMFLSWKMRTVEIVTGDPVILYGNCLFGFDALFSSRLTVGSHRVVCRNTFDSAIAEADENDKNKTKGKGTIYSGKHTDPHLLDKLGAWMKFIDQNSENEADAVERLFKKFAATPIIHEKQAEDLIAVAWPLPQPIPVDFPEELRQNAEAKVAIETKRIENVRKEVYNTYVGSYGIQITPDYWGLFNAGTQTFNSGLGVRSDSAYSICWGSRSKEMNHFCEVLRDDIYSKA
jgi:hypothetical protein